MISLVASSIWASGFGANVLAGVMACSFAPMYRIPELQQTTAVTQKHVAAIRVEDTLCSINAVDTELARVVQNLSAMTKANLVLLSGQSTKLTLRLSGVRLGDLLRHLCAISGLSMLKVGETFVIASKEQLQTGYPREWEASAGAAPKTTMITDAYVVNYANASALVESMKAAFPEGVSITLGPAQQSPALASQDTTTVTGVTSGVLQSDTGKQGRLIILRGGADVVADAISFARRMDYAREQVVIMVTIHDISNEALKEVGATWSIGDINITESGGQGIGIGSFNRSGMAFSAVIKALEKQDKAKLLASPSVSVLDGERAFILIGSRLSYPVLIGYSQANTPIYDKQTERVGIYLQVATSIASDGHITLNIYPQVSTVTGFLQVNGASYPQIATREAQTTLRVSNGETIILGGLLRDEEITQLEKVPLLADIPVLGEIFKRRKKTKLSSQVVISITPTIIKAKGDESR